MKCPSIHRFQKWILESKKPSLYKGVHVLALRSGEEFHFIVRMRFFQGIIGPSDELSPPTFIRGAAAAPLRAKRSGMRRYTDLPSRTWRPLDERGSLLFFGLEKVMYCSSKIILERYLTTGPTRSCRSYETAKALVKGRVEDDFPFGETMDG